MKKLFTAALIFSSVSAFAAYTNIEFSPTTMNCLVANDSGRDIEITSIRYEAYTYSGSKHWDTRECYSNCTVPAGLVARFRGPNNNPQIQSASCTANFITR